MIGFMVTWIVVLLIIVWLVTFTKSIVRMKADQTIRARKLADVDRKLDRILELMEKGNADPRQPVRDSSEQS
ncbi:DUF4083 family protein [Sporosarcina koreensis]|uniref:DUF4083 family protein n=1 Tax=Sporosarcina koreensis TaxID=334735 RepID=UPI00058D7905|nr:DUF4083 family protein [Sporosarcina koreensis]